LLTELSRILSDLEDEECERDNHSDSADEVADIAECVEVQLILPPPNGYGVQRRAATYHAATLTPMRALILPRPATAQREHVRCNALLGSRGTRLRSCHAPSLKEKQDTSDVGEEDKDQD